MKFVNTVIPFQIILLATLSGCASNQYLPKEPNVLVDKIELSNNQLPHTEFTLKGTISINNGVPYANKKIPVTGPIMGDLETDSTGYFNSNLWGPESFDQGIYIYPAVHLQFATAPDLAKGATVEALLPLAIEMTFKREKHNLIAISRRELMLRLSQTNNPDSRDELTAYWIDVSPLKPLTLTQASFYSDKNIKITETENLDRAARTQEAMKLAEIAEKENKKLQAINELEKKKRCAKQQKIISGKHLCSQFNLFGFMGGVATPDSDCIYRDEEFQWNYFSFIRVLSITGEGCLYFPSNSVAPANSNPIFVYRAGDPTKDLPVPEGIHPARWKNNIPATCGDIDLPLPDGYYAYAGPYSYIALRGNAKKVFSFRKLDIDRECID